MSPCTSARPLGRSAAAQSLITPSANPHPSLPEYLLNPAREVASVPSLPGNLTRTDGGPRDTHLLGGASEPADRRPRQQDHKHNGQHGEGDPAGSVGEPRECLLTRIQRFAIGAETDHACGSPGGCECRRRCGVVQSSSTGLSAVPSSMFTIAGFLRKVASRLNSSSPGPDCGSSTRWKSRCRR